MTEDLLFEQILEKESQRILLEIQDKLDYLKKELPEFNFTIKKESIVGTVYGIPYFIYCVGYRFVDKINVFTLKRWSFEAIDSYVRHVRSGTK